jgi:predicted MFS family arabinose efflux permease
VLIAGNFFVATIFMSVSGLLNEIATSLHVSVAQAGLLIAAFALTGRVLRAQFSRPPARGWIAASC